MVGDEDFATTIRMKSFTKFSDGEVRIQKRFGGHATHAADEFGLNDVELLLAVAPAIF